MNVTCGLIRFDESIRGGLMQVRPRQIRHKLVVGHSRNSQVPRAAAAVLRSMLRGLATDVLFGVLVCVVFLSGAIAQAGAEETVKALRLSNAITGGAMPTTDAQFQQMVDQIQNGNIESAALIAARSKYFAGYLARRIALQMQSPALDASIGKDNDATAFLIAHLAGYGDQKPSISSIWSENATYLLNITQDGTPSQVHAASLTASQLEELDWQTALTRIAGQMAKGTDGTPIAIPEKHTGGYTTLSDRVNDSSFAMYGATGGTNLRMIEGIWEIATGLSLTDVQSTAAPASDAPRFIPEYNPNFFHGQGQPACISCHGGGLSSLRHGYSTVADVFDFDSARGFTFIANPTVASMKSFGSDPNKRAETAKCDLTKVPTPVCNLESGGADPNQGWDLATIWSKTGVLDMMGWSGARTGQGLNTLGANIGQARIVYENLTKRIVREICPMGAFSAAEVQSIAEAANPFQSPAGTDDIRTIVAKVASHASCL